jgi:hypothetical protein
MAKQGQNEGFRVLDDFVCAALHASDAPRADERRQGRNEGKCVVEELVFEIPGEESKQKDTEDSRSASLTSPLHLNPSMRRLAEELAALIACQSDPVGVMALFQQKVIAHINAIQDEARASLQQKGPAKEENATG